MWPLSTSIENAQWNNVFFSFFGFSTGWRLSVHDGQLAALAHNAHLALVAKLQGSVPPEVEQAAQEVDGFTCQRG